LTCSCPWEPQRRSSFNAIGSGYLFFGADHRRIPESSLTVDDVAVLHENDMPAHLENILRVLPETKNVAVVVGNSSVERYWASELKRDFQPFANCCALLQRFASQECSASRPSG
jgi:hypothetical protein